MSIFQIRQKTSGAILWTGSADDEHTALDIRGSVVGVQIDGIALLVGFARHLGRGHNGIGQHDCPL